MKNKYWFWELSLVYVILLCCGYPAWGSENKEKNAQEVGSFECMLYIRQEAKLSIISDNTLSREMLKNELSLYFRAIKNAYFYVYAILPEKKFILISPESFDDFEHKNYFYTPRFFSLTDKLQPQTGCWEIHLLISLERQRDIENLLTALTKTGGVQKDEMKEHIYILDMQMKMLNIENILGYSSVELPEDVAGSLGRTTEEIKAWIMAIAKPEIITKNYQATYNYECE